MQTLNESAENAGDDDQERYAQCDRGDSEEGDSPLTQITQCQEQLMQIASLQWIGKWVDRQLTHLPEH